MALDEGGTQAPRCCIEGTSDSGDPSSDNNHVEMGFLEPPQG